MANLASPIPMMDPNTNNDSGYAPSNIDGDKEHTPPASPTQKEEKKEEKEKTEPPKKPELKWVNSCYIYVLLIRFSIVIVFFCLLMPLYLDMYMRRNV